MVFSNKISILSVKKAWAFCLGCIAVLSINISTTALPAFPGAEGHGADSISGGRGYSVYHVTDLGDVYSNNYAQNVSTFTEGQFGWALCKCHETGGGNIVFDVSGEIHLQKSRHIPSNVTIAGQTSPGGIAFVGGTLNNWKAENVIIRHIRIRGAEFQGDGISLLSGPAILDHISVSWACDGAIDITSANGFFAHDVTVQWSHLGDHATCHNEGYHAGLMLISYLAQNITVHHNLWTHANSRSPWYTPNTGNGTHIEVSNNVHYNY
ncbi:MAG: hypothetical protein ABIA63_11360, partial [bacterium]